MSLTVAYIAHPYTAETKEERQFNRELAAKWAAWAALQGLSPVCSWITLTGEIEETPELREMGLAIDCAQVERCDLMLMCGPRISGGMLREAGSAKIILDFTYLGFVVPTDNDRDEAPCALELSDGAIISLKDAEARSARQAR